MNLRNTAWNWLAISILFACSACASASDDVPPREPLPGAPTQAPDVERRISTALADLDSDYVPRTRHLEEDGSPKFTNRLILESSPYLRQHAHNPVNWYPWGDEAFAVAKRLGRPILLSIGYSTCHWCHVMEEESFEDEEIAWMLNANYIAIKVDREERPDLDAIYMKAVYFVAGRGGWPMTTWLTPDAEPFFGGTYFPARDGDRGTRKGFLSLLRELKLTYDEQPETVSQNARKITDAIGKSMRHPVGQALPTLAVLDAALASSRANFDPTNGGLKRAPKFPSSLPIRLLLRQHLRTGDPTWLDMASLTLEKMAAGGIYDDLSGGFHRYSTDARWLVPHFEKMLYDNALLTVAYLEGYQLTGNEDFARVARETLRYVGREMTAPGGGFYSATDADSLGPDGEREEGWFFTWTPDEVTAVVGKDAARMFQMYYGVTPRGNFEGRSILNVPNPEAAVAQRLGMTPDELRASLAASRKKLYEARSKRPAPLLDDKVLTSWNGLMISAFARGGFVLDEPDFVERAERAALFALRHSRKDGRLKRSFKDDAARHNAYVEDYAFLIAGLLDLYETTGGRSWLEEAVALQAVVDRFYLDAESGGYFRTSSDHEQLLAREKPLSDGAEPSGNSVALMNLLRLHELTTNDGYRATADRMLRTFSTRIQGASEMLLALDFQLASPKEVVIVTKKSREEAAPFLDALRRRFVPSKVVAVAVEGKDLQAQSKLVPLLNGKVARKGEATAYVCRQGVCKLPTSDVDVFLKQLTE